MAVQCEWEHAQRMVVSSQIRCRICGHTLELVHAQRCRDRGDGFVEYAVDKAAHCTGPDHHLFPEQTA